MSKMWETGPPEAEENAFEERMRRDVAREPRKLETAYDCQELGDALCNEGRVHDAVAHYRKAVEMEGDNPGYHTRLGDAYAYSEMSIKAVAEYPKSDEDLSQARGTPLQPR